jgi:hypothetical protein
MILVFNPPRRSDRQVTVAVIRLPQKERSWGIMNLNWLVFRKSIGDCLERYLPWEAGRLPGQCSDALWE